MLFGLPKMKWKRGLFRNLPKLDEAEPAFTIDTKQPFIGSKDGNVELAKQESLEQAKNDWRDLLGDTQSGLEAQINQVDTKTNEAINKADDVKNQFNRVVAEAGSNNPEVVQARGTEVNLNARLDKFTTSLADKAKKRYVDVRETAAVPDNSSVDNASVLKALLENNDYVRLDGKYYTNAITVDRTGKPPLTLEGNFELWAKDEVQPYILKFTGQVHFKGKMSLYGQNKVIDGLWAASLTSRSSFDNIYVEGVKRNGVFQNYVTLPQYRRVQAKTCGDRLVTPYTKISDSAATSGTSSYSTIQVSGIDSNVFDINGVHFVIIDGVLYRVVACNLVDGIQQLNIYPRNTSLSTGNCKILVGAGFFNEGTRLKIEDLDVAVAGVGFYQNSGFGATVNGGVWQGTPVGIAIGKDGIGSNTYQDNLINSPWLENDTEFPLVISTASGGGVTVIEPWTTTSNFKFTTAFGTYAPVTLIKNGQVYENNKHSKFIDNSSAKTVEIGKSLSLRSTSSGTTSQMEITINASQTKKFMGSTPEVIIYVDHRVLRNINLTPEAGFTIEGGASKLITDLRKGVIRVILDSSESNFIVIVQKDSRETQQSTAVILAGTTTLNVNHDLGVTPKNVLITPQGNIGNVWVTNPTFQRFTLNCSVAPSSDTTVSWQVIV